MEAVSARGREMTRVAMGDNGRMAAVFAPIAEIERILKTIDGYVVIANINSDRQAVIGGASDAVELAMAAFQKAGYDVVPLPVSHAFHTSIVAPASEPLRRTLERLHVHAAATAGRHERGRRVLSDRVPMPCPPSSIFWRGRSPRRCSSSRDCGRCTRRARACSSRSGRRRRCTDSWRTSSASRSDVLALFTNHPKFGDIHELQPGAVRPVCRRLGRARARSRRRGARAMPAGRSDTSQPGGDYRRVPGPARDRAGSSTTATSRASCAASSSSTAIPTRFRNAMLDKHITRLVKSANGDPTFEPITQPADVLKLAARGGAFDLRAGVRHSGRPHPGARPRDPPGDRRRDRRAARRRNSAGDALQDHHQGHATAATAGVCPMPCATTPA